MYLNVLLLYAIPRLIPYFDSYFDRHLGNMLVEPTHKLSIRVLMNLLMSETYTCIWTQHSTPMPLTLGAMFGWRNSVNDVILGSELILLGTMDTIHNPLLSLWQLYISRDSFSNYGSPIYKTTCLRRNLTLSYLPNMVLRLPIFWYMLIRWTRKI